MPIYSMGFVVAIAAVALYYQAGEKETLPGGELEFVRRRITTPVGPGTPRNFLRLKVLHP